MRRPTRRALAAALAAVAAAASAVVMAPDTPAGAQAPTLPAPNSHGITLTKPLDAVAFDQRLLDATVTTPAIFRPGTDPSIDPVVKEIKVRIWLPPDYRTDPARPYPVLYLLHGGAADWTSWSDEGAGDVRDTLAGLPFNGIVVMPEGGIAGFYTNWHGETDGHFRPEWETFHVQQLVPWIDANFNTIANRSGRAIAGLSMGGYGALRYAARFPQLFSAVGSFSGGTNINEPGVHQIVSNGMVGAGAAIGLKLWFNHGLADGTYRVNRKLPNGLIDPDAANQLAYRVNVVMGPASGRAAANPHDLADAYNAYDTRFGLYAGQDSANPGAGEGQIGVWNDAFHDRLRARGVVHRYCTGPGTHSFDDWREDLQDFVRYVYGTAPAECPNGWGAPRA